MLVCLLSTRLYFSDAAPHHVGCLKTCSEVCAGG